MGPHVLHKTALRKAAQVLRGKQEKSMTSYLVSLRSISSWLCIGWVGCTSVTDKHTDDRWMGDIIWRTWTWL